MNADVGRSMRKRRRTPARSLGQRLLVRVAELQGPMLDVVDVTHFDGTSVRDLLLEFMTGDPAASPAEVRVAIQELIDSGRLARNKITPSEACILVVKYAACKPEECCDPLAGAITTPRNVVFQAAESRAVFSGQH